MKTCLKCKTDFEKETESFSKNIHKTDGLQIYCKECCKKNSKFYYENNKDEHMLNTKRNKEKYIKESQEFILDYLKTHTCIDCPETDPVVMEFDHVRGKKYKSLSIMVSVGCSIELLKKEIEKCEVRCANCHRKKTAKQRNFYRTR